MEAEKGKSKADLNTLAELCLQSVCLLLPPSKYFWVVPFESLPKQWTTIPNHIQDQMILAKKQSLAAAGGGASTGDAVNETDEGAEEDEEELCEEDNCVEDVEWPKVPPIQSFEEAFEAGPLVDAKKK